MDNEKKVLIKFYIPDGAAVDYTAWFEHLSEGVLLSQEQTGHVAMDLMCRSSNETVPARAVQTVATKTCWVMCADGTLWEWCVQQTEGVRTGSELVVKRVVRLTTHVSSKLPCISMVIRGSIAYLAFGRVVIMMDLQEENSHVLWRARKDQGVDKIEQGDGAKKGTGYVRQLLHTGGAEELLWVLRSNGIVSVLNKDGSGNFELHEKVTCMLALPHTEVLLAHRDGSISVCTADGEVSKVLTPVGGIVVDGVVEKDLVTSMECDPQSRMLYVGRTRADRTFSVWEKRRRHGLQTKEMGAFTTRLVGTLEGRPQAMRTMSRHREEEY